VHREIPLYTLAGVPDAEVATHHFSTADGLGLSFLRFTRGPADAATEAVMTVHGLTTSTDMFIMPEHHNLVSYLLDHGFHDVWCLDFRMSNRHPYNLYKHRFTLDDVAHFDFPPAIATMRAHIGDRPIHVVSHCLGAASFTMSLFGKAVDGIASVIANSVALTPRVPEWSRWKLRFAPFVIDNVLGFPYVNPAWIDEPRLSRGRLFSKAVSRFHPECDVHACHMLSLMWGSGQPALYNHDNLADVTHRRGGDLYGPTSTNYHRHVRKMVAAGHAVRYDRDDPRHAELPYNYLRYADEIETPVLFMTGRDNQVFSDSNIVCFERLERIVPGRHQLHVFPGYGHQDPFMGEDVATDIFPRLLAFLEEHRSRSPDAAAERSARTLTGGGVV
jgi:lysosomal acid lipase/cholesteryl ester hydrolase